MLLLLPPSVERRTCNTKAVTDTGNAVGSAGARRDRGGHYRDLRRAKGPTCPTRARNTSFSIVSSPIRFIAAASSSLPASPSRSRNDPSIPDSARSRQRARARASAPVGTMAHRVPATDFPLIRHAADEAPLRACAQRSSVVPAPVLQVVQLVLWKAWTGYARPRFPQD